MSISSWFCASDLKKAVQGNRNIYMKKGGGGLKMIYF
jgi:hypothetical protein